MDRHHLLEQYLPVPCAEGDVLPCRHVDDRLLAIDDVASLLPRLPCAVGLEAVGLWDNHRRRSTLVLPAKPSGLLAGSRATAVDDVLRVLGPASGGVAGPRGALHPLSAPSPVGEHLGDLDRSAHLVLLEDAAQRPAVRRRTPRLPLLCRRRCRRAPRPARLPLRGFGHRQRGLGRRHVEREGRGRLGIGELRKRPASSPGRARKGRPRAFRRPRRDVCALRRCEVAGCSDDLLQAEEAQADGPRRHVVVLVGVGLAGALGPLSAPPRVGTLAGARRQQLEVSFDARD
mmetsp:Transcript_119621/g.335014  ORF Transcript_119621/g.335014 Transcript_119621/m.335014 type:complete len:288 (+) Transcript_119621:137-1000(+)